MSKLITSPTRRIIKIIIKITSIGCDYDYDGGGSSCTNSVQSMEQEGRRGRG